MFDQAYLTYLYQSSLLNSEVSKRSQRLEKAGYQLDYSSYILEVREQWANQPNFPRYEPALPDNPAPSFNLTQIINESFTFTGVKLVEGEAAYEFIARAPVKQSSRYAYALLTEETTLANANKLPFFNRWDALTPAIVKTYPSLSLFEGTIEGLGKYHFIMSQDLTHPLLPGFIFSGRVSLNTATVIYEYFDCKGEYGLQDNLYLSQIQPLYLDFPLGQLKFGDLELDQCREAGNPLNQGEVSLTGNYTGYKTTNTYHPNLTFFLYERQDDTSFLSTTSPDDSAINEQLIQKLYLVPDTEHTTYIGQESGSSTLTIFSSTTDSESTVFIDDQLPTGEPPIPGSPVLTILTV